ncbi:MAG: FG-GAP-like repeat-containing protein [Ignavibacteria bacterium]|nr:FG-GAP-like repeat-containing protein [Ignavibacteria bacterium]
MMNFRSIVQLLIILFLSGECVIGQESFHRVVTPFPVTDPYGGMYQLPATGGLNRPVQQFVDIDDDGDADLFIRDHADQLIFFENTGTAEIATFEWVTDTYAGIPIGGWFHFVDVDSDGDQDLFTDSPLSNMSYYRNEGTPGAALFVHKTDTLRDQAGDPVYVEIPTVPAWTDIDCDGNPDMFLGRLTGEIAYYSYAGLDGAGIPVFEHITETFQGLLIVTGGDDCMTAQVASDRSGRHGASAMAFADIDSDDDPDLFWGDFFAQSLLYLENLGDCTVPSYLFIQEQFPATNPICTGGFNIPQFTDIDNDGDADLFVGTQGGAYSLTVDLADNLAFYENTGTPSAPVYNLRTKRYISAIDLGDKAVPAAADIDNDGDIDLLLGNEAQPEADNSSRLHLFRNDGTGTDPFLVHADTNFLSLGIGYNYAPAFVDIDGDLDMDILMGEWTGVMNLLRNDGTPENPSFVLADENYFGIDVGNNSTPAFADIDNDGDQDMLIGEFLGNLNFYRNNGTAESAAFDLEDENYFGIDVDLYSAPSFADIDHDGDFDLFVGSDLQGIVFYRNTGTPEAANFVEDANLLFPLHFRVAPLLTDMDGDSDLDLIGGVNGGGIVFYENLENSTSVDPAETGELPGILHLVRNYPNPFNPVTAIEFRLARAGTVTVAIYDLNGSLVEQIVEGEFREGRHVVEWNAGRRASGVYVARVSAGSSEQTIKLVLLK